MKVITLDLQGVAGAKEMQTYIFNIMKNTWKAG